ncbi:MAG TPA: alpha/beta hydrolase [Nakamurella sp.]|nr:alpha/beta hydrolase [Nakamurella sp.]
MILLHGWPDAARGWHEIANILGRSGRRVIVPDNRGAGATRFLSSQTPRDGSAAALAQDALDLADALGLRRFAVAGHDWGARVAYSLAAVAPDRITALAALAVAYQPRGDFAMPGFSQARALWYQWLMYVDAGVEAIRRDPVGFAREQWNTWSPPGWFDDSEFAATAEAFSNPDWTAITLNAYRSRFLPDEPRDARYGQLRTRLAAVEHIGVPTLMIQGGSDFCDEPAASEGLDRYFDVYSRVVLDQVGHFPHREAPAKVAALIGDHLATHHT